MTWTCPGCGRAFARAHQSHGCSPALELADYFATGPSFERPVFDAVATHLRSVGPVRIEAVQVGILFKRQRTFAELRPGRDRLRLSLLVSRDLVDPRVVRRMTRSGRRWAVWVDLRAPADVDETVRAWLTEAYLSSPLT